MPKLAYRMPVTSVTSTIVGTTLKTKALSTKLMPLVPMCVNILFLFLCLLILDYSFLK